MSFDRLARHYRWMEIVFAGNLMQRCRAAFVTHTQHCRCALLAGEGPGSFLVLLLRHNPHIRVTCVEGSGQMIRKARAHLARARLDSGRVHFIQANALEWVARENTFDLVATHFFLDCFRPEQVNRLVRRLAASTTEAGTWLVSDFRVPAAGWQRHRAQLIVWGLHAFFRLATGLEASRLPAPGAALESAGFRLEDRREWSWGLVYSEIWRRIDVRRTLQTPGPAGNP